MTGGKYAFSVNGPDGFLSSFACTVVPASHNSGQVPVVTRRPGIHGRDHAGQQRPEAKRLHRDQERLRGQDQEDHREGSAEPPNWPANQVGYYDVEISANTSDGFGRRYAGRIA
jgi:phospholipase C